MMSTICVGEESVSAETQIHFLICKGHLFGIKHSINLPGRLNSLPFFYARSMLGVILSITKEE